jgi:peptidoglycan/xylan/chitin deacetylase (PgdA/CDA1 family)
MIAAALVGVCAVVAASIAYAVSGGAKSRATPAARQPVTLALAASKTPPTTRARPKPLANHSAPIPILMYHVLESPKPGAPYPELYVRSADFAGQVRWLATHGYHAVTLRQAYDYWHAGKPLPARPVVLSFDDGYRSVYTVGLPTLRRYGWVGVLNLAVEHEWTDLPPRFIWKLVAAGWELDSHTLTHVDVTRVDRAQLVKEIAGSRTFLRRQYHQPIAFFCYPAGKYDDAAIAEVRKAGYLAATTTNYGAAGPKQGYFTLDRVRIDGSDGVTGFAAKLRAVSHS